LHGDLISFDSKNSSFFFDFLPIYLGDIKGYKTKFHLYTVSDSSRFELSKKLIFKGVDGIVFVADSQKNRIEENLDALNNLKNILFDYGYEFNKIPFVFQYNKRDLNNLSSIEELSSVLNIKAAQEVNAEAINGTGVFETLKKISKNVLDELKSA
jgi:mutual gliding-motility protein MglA